MGFACLKMSPVSVAFQDGNLAQQMAASTTAATIFQAAEAQTLKDALDTVESEEEIASKAAAARDAKLQQVNVSNVYNERIEI